MLPLDNPIWSALSTSQMHFAQSAGSARRFLPEIGPLAGMSEVSDENYQALASLAGDDTVAIFAHQPPAPPASLKVLVGGVLLQMVHSGGKLPAAAAQRFETLGPKDVSEMLALVELTKPGPFARRTCELGTYLGVRVEGRLAAMAGERLRFPGYSEISAVCTHPDFLGRGYAGSLMAAVAEQIMQRGDTPFLHVRADNTRAIDLYTRLGFTPRLLYNFALLARTAAHGNERNADPIDLHPTGNQQL